MHRSLARLLLGLSCLSFTQTCLAEDAKVAVPPSSETKKQEISEIHSWFHQYDEIRRSAELTTVEKFEMNRTLSKGLHPIVDEGERSKSHELVSRTAASYAAAVVALKKLPPVAETKQLQTGYIQFFGDAEKVLQKFLNDQQNRPYTSLKEDFELVQQKKALDTLDRENKSIDHALREKYGIPLHKHK